MATPLRYDMTLPNGEPLRWNTPGARWGGTVEEVMAAQNQNTPPNMSTQNLVTGALTAAQVTAIQTAIETIRTNLPFAVDLDVDQRKKLNKLGDKSLAFVNRCRDLVSQNPAWLPATFPSAEFSGDLDLFETLGPIETQLIQLLETVSDTRMAAGSDALGEALLLYGIAKAAGQGANLDDLIGAMKTRYKRTAKNTTTSPTPPAA